MIKIANGLSRGGILAALATLLVLTMIAVTASPGEAKKKPPKKVAFAQDAGKLDGKDSTEFLAANGTAVDADKVDGKDSTELMGQQGPKGDKGDTGPQGPAGESAPKLFAVINQDGTTARGSGVTSSASFGGPGGYSVTFNQDVSNCAYLATLGIPDVGPAPAPIGEVYVGSSLSNDTVGVHTSDSAGNATARPFHLAVIC